MKPKMKILAAVVALAAALAAVAIPSAKALSDDMVASFESIYLPQLSSGQNVGWDEDWSNWPGMDEDWSNWPGMDDSWGTWPDTEDDGSSTYPGYPGGDWGTSDVPEATPATDEQSDGLVLITVDLAWGSGEATGTGMVIDSDGIVLTNHHVVQGSTEVEVTIPSTQQTYTADVVGYDDITDVAVLRLEGASGLETITASTGTVSVGDSITAVGNSGGNGQLMAAAGEVTGLDVDIKVSNEDGTLSPLEDLIEVVADVEPGVSGGALLNGSGQVVGMNVAGSDEAFGTAGYAIPMSDVMEVTQSVLSGNPTDTVTLGRTAGLGVMISDRRMSVQVVEVISGGPAEAAGITAGSTLTAIGSTAIATQQDLAGVLNSLRPDDQVEVSWTDSAGVTHQATVTLTEAPLA